MDERQRRILASLVAGSALSLTLGVTASAEGIEALEEELTPATVQTPQAPVTNTENNTSESKTTTETTTKTEATTETTTTTTAENIAKGTEDVFHVHATTTKSATKSTGSVQPIVAEAIVCLAFLRVV